MPLAWSERKQAQCRWWLRIQWEVPWCLQWDSAGPRTWSSCLALSRHRLLCRSRSGPSECLTLAMPALSSIWIDCCNDPIPPVERLRHSDTLKNEIVYYFLSQIKPYTTHAKQFFCNFWSGTHQLTIAVTAQKKNTDYSFDCLESHKHLKPWIIFLPLHIKFKIIIYTLISYYKSCVLTVNSKKTKKTSPKLLWGNFSKGLASYCKAETTFTFHFSILTL